MTALSTDSPVFPRPDAASAHSSLTDSLPRVAALAQAHPLYPELAELATAG